MHTSAWLKVHDPINLFLGAKYGVLKPEKYDFDTYKRKKKL
jgi:hypothetical protein